jgi:hypothetical protein
VKTGEVCDPARDIVNKTLGLVNKRLYVKRCTVNYSPLKLVEIVAVFERLLT